MEPALSQSEVDQLIKVASQARHQAYAPYSRLEVGAAILGSNDEIYIGCNVENASFGLTICAERVAVANAIAHGCRDFRALAVVSEINDGPATPCGACRQVLAEFSPTLTIICAGHGGSPLMMRLNDLLPNRFCIGSRR